MRDAIMTVSGGIDLTVGGPPIFPYVPEEILATSKGKGYWDNHPDGPDVWRRSVYVYRRRSLGFPFFDTFDLPDQNLTSAARNVSTVAPQALTLMNNEFLLNQARIFAERLEEAAPNDLGQQIDLAYRIALTRFAIDRRSTGCHDVGNGAIAGRPDPRLAQPERVSVLEVATMHDDHHHHCHCRKRTFWSRRDFLSQSGGGIGGVALAYLLDKQGLLAAAQSDTCEAPIPGNPFAPRAPHYEPRAKAVISLFMSGGVSHVDTFDPKPALTKYAGQPMAESVVVRQGHPGPLMPSPFSFKRSGESGIEVSEIFPHLSKKVDEMAFIRSLYGRSNDHIQATYEMQTGQIRVGFPSVGSWVTYGLGAESSSLPAFVVMNDYRGGPLGGPTGWSGHREMVLEHHSTEAGLLEELGRLDVVDRAGTRIGTSVGMEGDDACQRDSGLLKRRAGTGTDHHQGGDATDDSSF